jgi:H+-transporting ATPase
MSEATATDAGGISQRIVKGAFTVVSARAEPSAVATAAAKDLEDKGFRILAVAVGGASAMKLAGLIALSDPPRGDSAALVTELRGLGVRTVMVTGDAAATAAIVAKAVGLDGAVCPPGPIPEAVRPDSADLLIASTLAVGGIAMTFAGMGGGLDACRCGRLRCHPGFRESAGFATPSDHLGPALMKETDNAYTFKGLSCSGAR